MKINRSDGQETRLRLLKSASRVFADKGYWNATIAEICEEAKANIAAANYHFGGKEALYEQSWRYTFENSLEAYPPDGEVEPDAPVEERLRGRVLSIMRRIMDPENHELDIVHNELANPTGLLTAAISESVGPILEGFTSIIREILGAAAMEQDVQLCRMSIQAQCFGPLLRMRRRLLAPLDRSLPDPDPIMQDVETLADHVTCFSLAGINGMRLQIGRRQMQEQKRRLAEAADHA